MLRTAVVLLLWALPALSLSAQNRLFNDLFPDLNEPQRARVFSADGFIVSNEISAGLQFRPSPNLGVSIAGPVLERAPAFIVESLLVIPRGNNPDPLLTAYNALGQVRNLKGRLYHSSTQDEDLPLFEEATRIEGPRKTSAIPDPPGARFLPSSETVYIRLKDRNFGNSYYRSDITVNQRGLLYRLTNFRNLSYGIIPVIREDKFITQLYIEPIAEGLMIYSVSGADVSNFIASRVNIPSAIRKRVEVIIDWLVEGITRSPR
jgi:hypothetical protein